MDEQLTVRPAVRALVNSLDPTHEYVITRDLVAHRVIRQGRTPGSPIVFYDAESGHEIGLAFGGDYIRVAATEIRQLQAAVRDGHCQQYGARQTIASLNAQDQQVVNERNTTP